MTVRKYPAPDGDRETGRKPVTMADHTRRRRRRKFRRRCERPVPMLGEILGDFVSTLTVVDTEGRD